jgi:hypothetical protein
MKSETTVLKVLAGNIHSDQWVRRATRLQVRDKSKATKGEGAPYDLPGLFNERSERNHVLLTNEHSFPTGGIEASSIFKPVQTISNAYSRSEGRPDS